MAQDLYGMHRPVQQEVANQALETMRAGPLGMTASITPLLTRAVESPKIAGSQAQSRASDEMAKYGLTGTPFGQNTLQTMKQSGELQRSQLPTQMAYDDYNRRMSTLIPSALGAIPAAFGGMSNASSMMTQLAGGAQSAMAQQSMANLGLFRDIFTEVTSPGK